MKNRFKRFEAFLAYRTRTQAGRRIVFSQEILSTSSPVKSWRLTTMTVCKARNICVVNYIIHIDTSWQSML